MFVRLHFQLQLSTGDQIIFTDYARTWSTYAVTLDQGSLKYQGYDDP